MHTPVLHEYTLFQFCIDIHSFNENNIKKMIFGASFLAGGHKFFYGQVNPNIFEGREIKLTSTVKKRQKENEKKKNFTSDFQKNS